MSEVTQCILIISPEAWSDLWVSKHHYANALSRLGINVIYLNPPNENWKVVPVEENLKVVDYPKFPKGINYFPSIVQRYLFGKYFRRIEKICAVKIDLIWSFDNSVFFDFGFAKSNVKIIHHVVDLNMDFQFERACQTADICFAATRYILKRERKSNRNSFFLHHGCIPVDYSLIKRRTGVVKVGYAGNLDIRYIDWDLINTAVANYPNVEFYFAGKGNGRFVGQSLNVQLIGMLNQSKLEEFLCEMDVLLLAYQIESNREQLANPHKMMQYLSTGKPIVSTLSDEYEQLDCIYMAKSKSVWLDKLDFVISNLAICSTQELINQRRKYAFDHTYAKQLEKVFKVIDNVL
ncbi:MAG: hypothetical protein ACI8Q1_002478 [Parvicella sp.]|jgi:hypothetical protein